MKMQSSRSEMCVRPWQHTDARHHVSSACAARELVREVDYTLRTLSASLLGQAREDLAPPDVPRKYETSASLVGLCRHAESDAWLALGIMFHLSGEALGRGSL